MKRNICAALLVCFVVALGLGCAQSGEPAKPIPQPWPQTYPYPPGDLPPALPPVTPAPPPTP